METLYEGAVLIADDGRTVTDRAEIAAELERDLSLGLPLEAKARHVFVNGDIAQIVVDWSIDGTGPDGEHVHVEGTASDVARRGWTLAVPDRQSSWDGGATARLTCLRLDLGGDIQMRSAGLIRAGGTLVSVVGPTEARPADGLAVDFVVESDRAQLSEIVRRVRNI